MDVVIFTEQTFINTLKEKEKSIGESANPIEIPTHSNDPVFGKPLPESQPESLKQYIYENIYKKPIYECSNEYQVNPQKKAKPVFGKHIPVRCSNAYQVNPQKNAEPVFRKHIPVRCSNEYQVNPQKNAEPVFGKHIPVRCSNEYQVNPQKKSEPVFGKPLPDNPMKTNINESQEDKEFDKNYQELLKVEKELKKIDERKQLVIQVRVLCISLLLYNNLIRRTADWPTSVVNLLGCLVAKLLYKR